MNQPVGGQYTLEMVSDQSAGTVAVGKNDDRRFFGKPPEKGLFSLVLKEGEPVCDEKLPLEKRLQLDLIVFPFHGYRVA